ncbi:MAPEG family protein [Skermanella mucosa]|uniref:MAPEG family protein n=1 Tax=Skermanella mucosa TaxID=1789672 RepID=UPI00192B6CD0|nr:MAPEG family protein [Skermanella mucosa]UEM21825.1 MAPEG family protein [Skermanella mucosa]
MLDRRHLISAAGVVFGTALAWGGLALFWPGPMAGSGSAADRLALAAGLLVWPALLLVHMVFAVALARFFTAAFDPLNDPESRFQRRAQRALSNSVEQVAVYVPAMLSAAALADPGDIRFAGVMTGLFCVSRLLFWVGYLIHPYLRAPGMIMTLNVNVAIVGYALYRALG